jgi:hypothetical protein
LSKKIIAAASSVYRELGPGVLESVLAPVAPLDVYPVQCFWLSIALGPFPIQLGQDSDSEAYLTGAKSKIFYEFPISNLKFAHQVFPWGGGGYFRFIPFTLFKIGVKFILGKKNAYLFYFHPWEIDPEQPKVNQASSFYKFRHYTHLSKTHRKLSKLIESFAYCNFITCKKYLDEVVKYAQ